MKLAPVILAVMAGLLPAGDLTVKHAAPMSSPVKADETVRFFTSAAWPSGSPGLWKTEIRGIIFEEERNAVLEAALRKVLGIDADRLSPGQRAILNTRLPLFLNDNERGKSIPVLLDGSAFRLPDSEPNGHFRGRLEIKSLRPRPLSIEAVLRPGDLRKFNGQVLLMDDGPSPLVVSDIDDTIKITNVRDRRTAVQKTFCEPFEPVPGMAARYRQWSEKSGAVYHYVSGSPWQLYPLLEGFTREHQFPAGAWYLKHLRLADPSTLLAFLGPQQEHKLSAIAPLLDHWKHRPLVLVGDSGEQDPEIYGELARRFAQRVQHIFIRNVSSESRAGKRMIDAFKDIPAEKWSLFSEASELPDHL